MERGGEGTGTGWDGLEERKDRTNNGVVVRKLKWNTGMVVGEDNYN